MDNIGKNYNLPSSQKIQEAARNVGGDILASFSGPASRGELGNIGKDVCSVIDKWSEHLHSALQKWSDDEGQLEDLINKAKTVVSEYQLFMRYYEQCKQDGNDELFPPGYINHLKSVMNMLGVPPSLVNTGSLVTTPGSKQGWYNLTPSDMLEDCRLIAKYAAKDYLNYAGQFGNLQQAARKDMLAVMYDITAIKENQQALTGILSTLKEMAQAAEGNIQ